MRVSVPSNVTMDASQVLTGMAKTNSLDLAPFEELYKDIHRNPELSEQEYRTAGIVVEELNKIGSYKVIKAIGGHGVVGILENGPGAKVLLRADMDALPVPEQTGLPYASKKKMLDVDGKEVSVMHACGHDVHVACLLGVARFMSDSRDRWSGTLIALFQPAEEFVSGAKAMVDDGLYDPNRHAVPVPDIVLGQHVYALKSGNIAITPGLFFSEVHCMNIRVFGKGSHGVNPHLGIDPVLTAAHIVVRLQSLITRSIKPDEMAVLSVGSIRGGDAPNVIPDFADLKLTFRAYTRANSKKILDGVKRVVRAECEASGCEKEPDIEVTMHVPPTINSEEETPKVTRAFKSFFGEKRVEHLDPLPGGEDFPHLADAVGKPYVYWFIGGVEPSKWDEAEANGDTDIFPVNHSPLFAPVVQPTIKTGIEALSLAALAYLKCE